MPSFQYTRNFKDEDFAQEPAKQYTKKEKFENWCDYYLKWTIIGIIVLGIIIYSVIDIYFLTPDVDFNIAIISQQTVLDETKTNLENTLIPLASDINGDGQTLLTVSHYYVQFDFSEQALAESEATESASSSDVSTEDLASDLLGTSTQALDPYMIMAGQTQLAGDAEAATSNIWITNDPVGLQEYSEFFCYFDGSTPAEGEEVVWAEMFYRIEDCPALADIAPQLPGYYIGRRSAGVRENSIESFNNNADLWNAITAGATQMLENPS